MPPRSLSRQGSCHYNEKTNFPWISSHFKSLSRSNFWYKVLLYHRIKFHTEEAERGFCWVKDLCQPSVDPGPFQCTRARPMALMKGFDQGQFLHPLIRLIEWVVQEAHLLTAVCAPGFVLGSYECNLGKSRADSAKWPGQALQGREEEETAGMEEAVTHRLWSRKAQAEELTPHHGRRRFAVGHQPASWILFSDRPSFCFWALLWVGEFTWRL